MWEAMAQLGSGMIMNRHQAHFQEQSASKAFDRQVAMKQWDERLANTAHQREVTDLRAAGLNPILSATKGLGGAPGAPTSAVSPGAAPGGGSPGVDFAGASAKSAAAQLSGQQSKLVDSQIAQTDANTAKTIAEIPNVDLQGAVLRATADNLGWSSKHFAALIPKLEQEIVESGQRIAESAQRIHNLVQEVKESQSRIGVQSSTIRLNDQQRKVMLEQISNIQAQTGLTKQQRDNLNLLESGLRNKSAVEESAFGEFFAWADRFGGVPVPMPSGPGRYSGETPGVGSNSKHLQRR